MQSAANRKVQFSHTSKNTLFCFNGPGYGGRGGDIFGPCGQIWVIGQNGRFVGPDMLFHAESGSNTPTTNSMHDFLGKHHSSRKR